MTEPNPPPPPSGPEPAAETAFLRRVLIVAAVTVLALLLWAVRDALLLLFAAVMIAVLLLAAARPFRNRLGLSHGAALALGGGSVLAVLVLAGWLVGSQVRAQVEDLVQRLPQAAQSLEQRFGIELPDLSSKQGQEAAMQAASHAAGGGGGGGGMSAGLSELSSAVGSIAALGAVVVDALSALFLAVVGGLYLAGAPDEHKRGVLALLPHDQQRRGKEFLDASGNALHGWLLATLGAMAVVGTMVGLGTWALGLPAALALGLFIALTEIVPVIGPIIGAVPALLLALGAGGATFAWTLALFVVVQQIESNLLQPMLQKRMADVPPVLLLLSVVAIGTVFGVGGLVLAAPITVVAFVAVQKLYVRETLGNPADVPGEDAKT
jgi:predicted PurR-regulated permease PerM